MGKYDSFTSEQEEGVCLFVGPHGCSDERAIATFDHLEGIETYPLVSLKDLVLTADLTPGVYGVLPLEDNINGEFRQVYDLLIEETKKSFVGHVRTLKEKIVLCGLPNANPDEIETILSHDDIIAQYSNFFMQGGVSAIPVANTSIACADVKKQGNPKCGALAPLTVARQHGLEHFSGKLPLEIEIQTRYGLLGQTELDSSEGDNFVSILYCEPQEDRSGTLSNILDSFRAHNINLRRLRSQNRGVGRPHGFVFEMEGHPHQKEQALALRELVATETSIKILGVFPDTGDQCLSPEKPIRTATFTETERLLPQ